MALKKKPEGGRGWGTRGVRMTSPEVLGLEQTGLRDGPWGGPSSAVLRTG